MNNLLSYCGLIDERISASEKDLPVVEVIVFSSLTLVTKYWLSKNVSKHKPDLFIHSFFLKGKQKRKERRLTSINYEGHCICLVCTFIFSLYSKQN